MSAAELTRAAHAYLDGYDLAPGTMVGHLEIGLEDLKRTFQIFVELDHETIDDEKKGPHPSKHLGRPWLPKGTIWPRSSYFFAQLELAKLAPFDTTGTLPNDGLLTLFIDPFADDFGPASSTAVTPVLVAADGELELLPRPKKSELPQGGKYYEQTFFRRSYALTYQPAFNFSYLDELPDDLTQGLAKELGLSYVADHSSTAFGTPVTWQGEDDLFADPEWDWTTGPPPGGQDDHVLLFQTPFLEGTFHCWVHRERLAAGDLSVIQTTASVT